MDKTLKTGKEDSAGILYQSMTVQCLIIFYQKLKEQLSCYLKTSKTYNSVKKLSEEFSSSFIRVVSIIVIAATFINLLFSILVKKEISFLSWIIWGLFLFIGLAGLFCKVGWKDIRKTSLAMKYIKKEE
jgi:predicted membrane channel-forming protein YqfA (hemolysin III family)